MSEKSQSEYVSADKNRTFTLDRTLIYPGVQYQLAKEEAWSLCAENLFMQSALGHRAFQHPDCVEKCKRLHGRIYNFLVRTTTIVENLFCQKLSVLLERTLFSCFIHFLPLTMLRNNIFYINVSQKLLIASLRTLVDNLKKNRIIPPS